MLKRKFQSIKFNDAGFRPLHPIDPRNSDCLVEESSFIIKSFASQEVDKRTARRYLYSLENAPRSTKLKGELVLIRTYLSTIVSSRRGGPSVFKDEGHRKAKIKRDLLQLYQKALQPSIKGQNMRSVKEAKQTYKLKKINLSNYYEDHLRSGKTPWAVRTATSPYIITLAPNLGALNFSQSQSSLLSSSFPYPTNVSGEYSGVLHYGTTLSVEALIDSQGITNITVQPHPHAIEEASCIVTPEHINRHIQLIKDNMKLDWTRSQTMVKY
ncbi:hypothetical protein HMPREF1544_00620 [Mucor circinelloides 1006PhL]|uniref:Uncharacterized protein n=1 Tax=Mucor circinelloides f. circinelloides (strain 1006PhL) TaxID=1220926 RepID=S2JVY7_MUCC1|nr:hypothetical protein HMPREF1544_00620 [Mucor circinelloides 1006PhL]